MAFGVRGRQEVKSTSERVATHRQKHRTLDRREPEDKARRRRMERNPAKWLQHYMPAAFPLPFGDAHHKIIQSAIDAADTGSGVAVAAPRGEGKTTILRGISLYLVSTGRARFPVMAGWTHKSAKEAFRLWLRMLHVSPELRADYPELTQPFEESTHSARIKNLIWDSGESCGVEINAIDRVIVLPSSIGAIAASSVQGDVKGLNVTLHDGSVLRPDLLLIDDAQDSGRAGDPAFVADVVEGIEKQWMCLAGPQSRITTMVACTVAAKGDVSEHFLHRSDFRGIRVSRVTSWPDGWDERNSETRRLWDDWHEQLLDGYRAGKGGKFGLDFYKANKAAMTQGMSVSWKHRLDKSRKDPDAMYSAMVDYYRIGESAFASEYQNQPINQGVTLYNLSPEVIQSRTTDRRPGDVPEYVRLRVAATDINPSFGMTWGIVGFGADQSAAVLGYGIHKMHVSGGATRQEADRAIYENLVQHGRKMAEVGCAPELWFIDAGGAAFDVALKFANESRRACGIQAIPCTGRGARNYRPYGKSVLGRPREQCHMAVDQRGRKWVAWNTDYWREIAQTAWTGSVGAPGACNLPHGHHREFAEQICREQLRGKEEIGGQMVWVWDTAPGNHDYGDVMSMCYMGAAWGGIGTAGPVQRQRKPKRQKVRMVNV